MSTGYAISTWAAIFEDIRWRRYLYRQLVSLMEWNKSLKNICPTPYLPSDYLGRPTRRDGPPGVFGSRTIYGLRWKVRFHGQISRTFQSPLLWRVQWVSPELQIFELHMFPEYIYIYKIWKLLTFSLVRNSAVSMAVAPEYPNFPIWDGRFDLLNVFDFLSFGSDSVSPPF